MTAGHTASAPLVSIITPTFNMGDRLQRCITSVQSQTYPHIEHLVIDGASSDGTLDLLQAAGGIRWISEPDRGQSHAINKGLTMAKGDVLGWLNADDELIGNAIERVVEALRRSPEVGLVYGDIELVEGGRTRRVAPCPTFGPEELWKGNRISQPGTFWTRWAQDRVGVLDEEFHLTMDYELWLRFAHAGIPAVYVPEVLARFEVHPASKTGSAASLAFAEEEARALRKHGDVHGAAQAIDRWYWDDVIRRVGASARSGRRTEASQLARTALHRMRPVRDRVRWFLWLARVAPRLAGIVHRRSGRSVSH